MDDDDTKDIHDPDDGNYKENDDFRKNNDKW